MNRNANSHNKHRADYTAAGWRVTDIERGAAMNRQTDDDLRVVICAHGPTQWDISPYDGDVWCFRCKPPRNLSDAYRRMTEALDNEPPTD